MREVLGVIVFFIVFFIVIYALFAVIGKGLDVTVNNQHYHFSIQEAK